MFELTIIQCMIKFFLFMNISVALVLSRCVASWTDSPCVFDSSQRRSWQAGWLERGKHTDRMEGKHNIEQPLIGTSGSIWELGVRQSPPRPPRRQLGLTILVMRQ